LDATGKLVAWHHRVAGDRVTPYMDSVRFQQAGGKDNILIGDATIWDANAAALQAIFAEWTRTDQSFEQRVSHLISTGTGGLNGSYGLDKKSVIADSGVDALFGNGQALDWFFVTQKVDTFATHDPRDHITQV